MGRNFFNYDNLISILAGTATVVATAIAQPAIAAKTAQEVAKIALDTTVQINNLAGDPGGTGAIIAKQGAIADFQKAAEIYQQQGNQENYQKVQELLQQLQP